MESLKSKGYSSYRLRKEKIFGEFRKRGISENQIVLKNYEN